MFSPSTCLRFRSVPALNKLKIHQPLPLSPRESTQLLNLLTTSFRQHLDSEHGQIKTDNKDKLAIQTKGDHGVKPRQRRRSSSDSWQAPVDLHMHSLLTNPLFTHDHTEKVLRGSRRRADLVDPLVLFDSAVARGMMDINHAKVLLQAKKRDIVDSAAPSIRDGMRQSGAGFRVLRWLISSGTTTKLDFLKSEHREFVIILMQYIVAEDLQEAAWTWVKTSFKGLSRLSTTTPSEQKAARLAIAGPLLYLMQAEASGSVSLDKAYMCLSRATGYLQGYSMEDMRVALGPAGRWLVSSTIHARSRHPPSSESNFESFLSLVPMAVRSTQYNIAHLTLVHPTRPSANLAVNVMRDMEQEDSTPLARNREYIQLGLDTARFLLEHHEYKEADWAMSWLQRHFSAQLGEQQVKEMEQAKAEASSLDLLEGLSLV